VPTHSLFLFGLPSAHWTPIAQRAEAEGYDVLWIGDHLVWPAEATTPYPYREGGTSPYSVETRLTDVWMTVAHLAARTERIRLAPGVLIGPLRHPLSIARSAQTAQTLAPDRVLLGLGSGWLREEFDALGVPFAERGRRLEEIAQILRKAWDPGSFSHDGEAWSFADVDLGPRPDHAPPIVLGGFAPAALRRAARYGDGWLGTGTTLEAAEKVRRSIEATRSEEGIIRPFAYRARLESLDDMDLVRAFTAAGFTDLAVHLRDIAPDGAPLDVALDAISAAADAFRAGQQ
jgi:probable F420-dependent oxidoreductase